MAGSSESIRLELSVNGEVLATGGVSMFGVVTAMVVWVRRSPESTSDLHDEEREELLAEHLYADLGGLDSISDESVKWLDDRRLQIGDEVTIRVLPPGPIHDAEREPYSKFPGHEDI